MVINHLEKLFVTSDCCTIVREMEVAHPAAKILCLGANRQSEEASPPPAIQPAASRQPRAARAAARVTARVP